MLFLLFIGLPFLELWLLFAIGDVIGGWETLALVFITGAVGAALAKREGLRLWSEIQESLARHEVPEESLVSGLLLLVGGVCLVTPGVITDVFGLSMLFAPVRRGLARQLRKRFGHRIQAQVGMPGGPGPFPGPFGGAGFHAASAPGDEVIDVEAEVVSSRTGEGDSPAEPSNAGAPQRPPRAP